MRKEGRQIWYEKSGGVKIGTRKVEARKVRREKWGKKSGARKVGREKWDEKSGTKDIEKSGVTSGAWGEKSGAT